MTRAEIVADHGPGVGLGHVRRCLVLADELRRRGVAVRFLVPTAEGRALAADHGFDVGAWDEILTAEVLIVDAYGETTRSLGVPPGALTVWLDDVGGRDLDVDLVINVNGYGPEIDYQGSARHGVLAGLEYSLVSPAFVGIRTDTARAGVVVAFGGSDDGRLALPVAERLRRTSKVPVDVVVSPLHERGMSAPHGVRIHHGADMLALMAARKVYVGAAGGTSYEALAAGLAVVACSTHDNQDRNAQYLAALAAAVLPRYDVDALVDAALTALDAPSPVAPAQPDGMGAARVADRILELAEDPARSARSER